MSGNVDGYAKLNGSSSSLLSGGSPRTTSGSATPMNHKSTDGSRMALEQMNNLRRMGCLCDVTLVVGEKQIHAHRLLLAAWSNYFKAMFTNEMAESRQQEIQMVDIGEGTLQALVDFCYTETITITDANVQQLLPAACLLQMQEVQDVCCEFLKKQLEPTNCLGIRAFADTHGCRDLFKVADKYVLDNFEEVLNTEEFLLLPVGQLCDVLGNDELNVKSEENVYKGVMAWTRHDLANREKELAKVFENVRLPVCSPKFIVNVVSTDPLIKSNITCRDLVDEAKNYLLLPSERPDRQCKRTKPRKPSMYGQLLYAVGGWCSGDAIASVERMDARTGEWRSVAPMSKRRCGVGVATLDGLLYAVGGHDGQRYLKCVERYDPKRNIWSSDVAPTSTCRTSVGVAVYDGFLYAVGGQDGVSCLNIVERYDPRRNEWQVVAPMNSKRLGVSVSVLDGCLYAVGGADGQCPLATVERYDPRTDKWYNVRAMATRRKHLGSAVYKDHLYAVGGRAESCELNSCEKYDAKKDQWLPVVPMNSRRSGVGLAVVNDQLYAVGGFDGMSYLKTVEVFEEDECPQWRHAGSMFYRRLGGGFAVLSLTNDELVDCTASLGASTSDPTCLDLGYDLAYREC
ncbi:kelch-like protein 20-like protein [Aphelenchoides avenae]|nr:kelch-like protein 20-like protein [Aphelenchus avenae]